MTGLSPVRLMPCPAHQRRLPQELRTANIKTLEQANEFLKTYIQKFNSKFALKHNNTSVFENKPTIDKINQTLAIVTSRVFDSGSSIKFKNDYYKAYSKNDNNVVSFKKGVRALVIKTFDNKLYASVEDDLYVLIKLDSHQKYSKDFDIIQEEKPNKLYVPPMSHPWKRESYMSYINKLKSSENYRANV